MTTRAHGENDGANDDVPQGVDIDVVEEGEFVVLGFEVRGCTHLLYNIINRAQHSGIFPRLAQSQFERSQSSGSPNYSSWLGHSPYHIALSVSCLNLRAFKESAGSSLSSALILCFVHEPHVSQVGEF